MLDDAGLTNAHRRQLSQEDLIDLSDVVFGVEVLSEEAERLRADRPVAGERAEQIKDVHARLEVQGQQPSLIA